MTRNQKHTYAALFTCVGIPAIILLWAELIGFGGSAFIAAIVLLLSFIFGFAWVFVLAAMGEFQVFNRGYLQKTNNPVISTIRNAWIWFNSND